MKIQNCPACNIELLNGGENICTNCLLDLRKFKLAEGEKVSREDTSYQELLEKVKIFVAEDISADQLFTESPFRKIFNLFFRKKKSITNISLSTETSESQPNSTIPILKVEDLHEEERGLWERHDKLEDKSVEKKNTYTINPEILANFRTLNNDLSYFSHSQTYVRVKLSTKRPDLTPFFKAALKELDDPNLFAISQALINKKIEKIESKVLQKQLESTKEKLLQEDLSLKRKNIIPTDRVRLQEAGIFHQLTSFVIDLAFILFVTGFVTIFLRSKYDLSISTKLFELNELSSLDLFSLVGILLALLPLSFCIYQFASHIFLRFSLGEFLTETRILTSTLRRPSILHYFVRDFSMPLTVISGALIFPLFINNSISSLLSRTKVVKPTWG